MTYQWIYEQHGLDWSSESTVTLRLREAPAGPDATLSALVVNDDGRRDLTLRPGFAPGTTSYRASVTNDVAEVTVMATPNDSGATIEYLDASDTTLADADTSDTVQPVTLAEGDNVVKVKVTAKDTITTRDLHGDGDAPRRGRSGRRGRSALGGRGTVHAPGWA